MVCIGSRYIRVLGQHVDPQAYKNQMQGAQTDPGVAVLSQGVTCVPIPVIVQEVQVW